MLVGGDGIMLCGVNVFVGIFGTSFKKQMLLDLPNLEMFVKLK